MEESQTPVTTTSTATPVIKPAVAFGENDVGISTFLSNGISIKGITKYRIADFIVNEVTPDHVTLYPLEKEERIQVVKPKKTDEEEGAAKVSEYALTPETETTIKKLFGTEKGEKLI